MDGGDESLALDEFFRLMNQLLENGEEPFERGTAEAERLLEHGTDLNKWMISDDDIVFI